MARRRGHQREVGKIFNLFIQLVTDPALVTKSLKPRRFYYAPIGDGVVAADGVELKRLPPDLTPKVEVIQQRIVEKGPGGKAGVKVTEKTWSTGGAILRIFIFSLCQVVILTLRWPMETLRWVLRPPLLMPAANNSAPRVILSPT